MFFVTLRTKGGHFDSPPTNSETKEATTMRFCTVTAYYNTSIIKQLKFLIFLDKLRVICSYLRDRIVTPSLKPSNIYILSKDLAFFSLDFFSDDRGSDLGQVKSADVLHLPDEEGFLVNQVFGKHSEEKVTMYLVKSGFQILHIAL